MIASRPQQLWYSTVETPVGTLAVLATEIGLAAITFPDDIPEEVRTGSSVGSGDLGRLPRRLVDVPVAEDAARVAPAVAWLRGYFDRADDPDAAGDHPLAMPLDAGGTEFENAVWQLLREIPRGETRSYGDLAAALGKPGAARAVGLANGKNPLPILIPCHRVIGASGKLTGFGGGLWRKELLLGLERGGQLPL